MQNGELDGSENPPGLSGIFAALQHGGYRDSDSYRTLGIVWILLLKSKGFTRIQNSGFFGGECLTALHNSVECAFSDSGVVSSAGRASALQAEGRRFDPVTTHHVIPRKLLPWTGSSVG
jgi:hypothetical protein